MEFLIEVEGMGFEAIMDPQVTEEATLAQLERWLGSPRDTRDPAEPRQEGNHDIAVVQPDDGAGSSSGRRR